MNSRAIARPNTVMKLYLSCVSYILEIIVIVLIMIVTHCLNQHSNVIVNVTIIVIKNYAFIVKIRCNNVAAW